LVILLASGTCVLLRYLNFDFRGFFAPLNRIQFPAIKKSILDEIERKRNRGVSAEPSGLKEDTVSIETTPIDEFKAELPSVPTATPLCSEINIYDKALEIKSPLRLLGVIEADAL
jgi:hypothetical protein